MDEYDWLMFEQDMETFIDLACKSQNKELIDSIEEVLARRTHETE